MDLFHGGGYGPFDLLFCSNGSGGGCIGANSQFTGNYLDVQNGSGLSILTGNFNLTTGVSGAAELLTIVDTTPVAVTPESSSLMLLGTGLLGMAGIVKRRFV